jgi:hypothetical protein
LHSGTLGPDPESRASVMIEVFLAKWRL